ncbi:cytokine-like protein 1 [Ambystoma mexicanum]|uniref:cytokine-like protein 1 n=1 Tax=Ambystoma mexicanum TaxID=8296 RepID=UPI0037E7697E
MKLLLILVLANVNFFCIYTAPPTCYSRVLALSKEIMDTFETLQRSVPAGPCIDSVPNLYLDIHNSCVMAKLRSFISAPRCGKFPRVSALKEKVRNLYNIMNGVCRRDLVFFYHDCNALEIPRQLPTPTLLAKIQSSIS